MNTFKKQNDQRQQAIILDTCALIDGRIIDIAKAGFVPRSIIIPQFVIAELQFLADRGDSHKRERARYGLDVIRSLQDMRQDDVEIAREQFADIKEVDDKLIALAKQYGAMLYTTDFNLNKVAQIEGVHVLNVNELAQALRPHRLPGERVELKITQTGQDKSQGVGYLDDGTMVVVEKAGNKIGQRIQVEFSRILQTQAGKMMFAVLPERQQIVKPAPRPQQPAQLHVSRPQPAAHGHGSAVAPSQQAAPPVQQSQQQQVPRSQAVKDERYKPRNNKLTQPKRTITMAQPSQQQLPRWRRKKTTTPEDALLRALRQQG
jgi:rRNA-processing protein FCF1